MSERVDATIQANPSPAEASRWHFGALLDGLWRLLVDVRLLLLAIGLTLLFVLIGLAFPQAPDQLRADPGEATRWLLATAEQRGALGEVISSVGLFDLLHSPVFQLALAMIGLLLLIHLAFALGAALQLRGVAKHFGDETGVAGEPWPIPPGRAIHRLRRTLSEENADTAADLDALLETSYPSLQRAEIPVAPPPYGEEETQPESVLESRTLAVRTPWAAWLRLLLPVGLLFCTASLLLLARQGWEITVPALEPGASSRFAAGDLLLRYQVSVDSETYFATPTLAIEQGAAQEELPLGPGAWARVGGVLVAAQPATPAMLIRTRGDQPMLTQPGQSTPADSIGLIFPAAGSEEALLLPRQGAGLRIVRAASDQDAFVVELYRGDATEPAALIPVADNQPATLLLSDGEIVDLLPLRAVDVTVRSLPGLPLLVVGIILSIAGLVGYWRRPGFALIQVAPWSDSKRVLVAQSDGRGVIAALEEELADA